MDPVATPKPKGRKPGRRTPSVIEANPAVPMPVVDAEPVTASEPEASAPVAAETPVAAPTTAPIPESVAAPVPATPPAAVSAEPAAAEDIAMDTTNTAAEATATAQTMFADLNGRASGAMERGTKMVEEMAAFGKGNMEAMVESGRIAARGFESLGQDAAAFAKQSFEQSTAAMRQLAAVKSPTEFMTLQSDLMRQSFDQMVQQSSRQTETVLKLAGEVAQPLSNRMAVAAQKAKVAA